MSSVCEVPDFHAISAPFFQRRLCGVPGCNTYDISSNFLPLPLEPFLREHCPATLPSKNNVTPRQDKHTLMCFKHLESENVSLCILPNGKPNKTNQTYSRPPKRKIMPLVLSNCGFENFPKMYWPKIMFEISKRDDCPETFGDLENADFIGDFNCFLKLYAENLREALQTWKSIGTKQDVTFYALDYRGIPKVATSVKVNHELKVTVALDVREMDPADLTWIIPVNRRVNRWSQLKILLKHFSSGVLGFHVLSDINGIVALQQ